MKRLSLTILVCFCLSGCGGLPTTDSTEDRSMLMTSRLGLPLIEEGQSGSEETLGEAFWIMEMLRRPTIISAVTGTPPSSPTEGDIYYTAYNSTGAWYGNGLRLAIWNGTKWVFVTPWEGMEANLPNLVAADDIATPAVFTGGTWKAGQCPFQSYRGEYNSPPYSTRGYVYVVGISPTGDFAGKTPGVIMVSDGTSWNQLTPQDGWWMFNRATNSCLYYDSATTSWIAV